MRKTGFQNVRSHDLMTFWQTTTIPASIRLKKYTMRFQDVARSYPRFWQEYRIRFNESTMQTHTAKSALTLEDTLESTHCHMSAEI